MKLVLTALFGLAATAPTSTLNIRDPRFERITIGHAGYDPVHRYPVLDFLIKSERSGLFTRCSSDYSVDVTINDVYHCTDSSYTFRMVAEHGSRLRVARYNNGPDMAGEFDIEMKEDPWNPGALEQVGTVSGDLSSERDA